MSDEYGPINIGAFSAPMATSPAIPTLADADPATKALLSFVGAVLAVHIGDRFAAAAAAVKPALVTPAGGALSVVGTAIPYDPSPFLPMVQYAPPFLALFPESETPREQTREQYRSTAVMTLQWVLPPLTPAQALDMIPFLRAAFKVILARIEQGYDPEVDSGALFCEAAGIAELKIREARYGRLEVAKTGAAQNTTLYFPTLDITLELAEQKTANPTDALGGVDTSIEVANVAPPVTVVETSEDL